jgi:uncharacterized protein YkwD
MMNLVQLHNHIRKKKWGFPPLEENEVLNNYAFKAAKWMGHRTWTCFWNFDRTRETLIDLGKFEEVDFNIAVGACEDIVIKHLINNHDKVQKICNPFFKYMGYASYNTDYVYWTILYAY